MSYQNKAGYFILPACMVYFVLLSGCSSPSIWTGSGEEITEISGDKHCDLQDVTFLRYEGSQFIRDPKNVIPADQKKTEFKEKTELPVGAIDTGLRSEDRELWIAKDSTAIYVVTGKGIEQWPEAVSIIGCD